MFRSATLARISDVHHGPLAPLAYIRTDSQWVYPAIGDADRDGAVIMLSYHPDFAETLRDSRVSLMLSGLTNGGPIFLPGYGARVVSSAFGRKTC